MQRRMISVVDRLGCRRVDDSNVDRICYWLKIEVGWRLDDLESRVPAHTVWHDQCTIAWCYIRSVYFILFYFFHL